MSALPPVIEASGLHIAYGPPGHAVEVVRGVDLTVGRGEAVGLVGESGSGKSMTALGVMRLLPRGTRIAGGSVRLEGRPLLDLSEREMALIRGRDIAMIFQDPLTSLNPAFSIGRQLTDALRAHRPIGSRAALDRAAELLDLVGIASARARLAAYPHEFSGGMRQRVAIAIAVACQPKLLIADEPTTALDVTIQAQILDLLISLREKNGMALVLITHDMGVVAETAHRVVVQYAGQQVETNATRQLFADPHHPYTHALLAALPERATERRLPAIPGVVPGQHGRPPGCLFEPRCAFAFDACRTRRPGPAAPELGRALCFTPLSQGVPAPREVAA